MKKCTFFITLMFLLTTMAFIASDADIMDGVVGIWLFDEGSGEQAGDSFDAGNDGDFQGKPKWVKGKFGKCLEFNGSGDFIEVPDAKSLDLEKAVTMVCWFNWEGTGDGWQTFFSKGPMSGPNENYAHFTNSGNRHTHFCKNAGGARNCFNSPNNAFEAEKWHHTAAIYDGKKQYTYIDGKLVAEAALTGKMVTNDNYLGLGFREGSGHYWKGMLDDMALFNRALSGDEVEEIMDKGLETVMAVTPQDRLTVMWGSIKSR